MRIDSTTSMLFEGFNESVNIVLPPEARKAQPFPQGLAASNETVPVASTEGEMGLSESISNTSGLSESIQNAAGLNESSPNYTEAE